MNVSVIVTCLNEEENIKECVYSILNQTYSRDMYEIIVVDGGSRDRTQDIIKEIVKSYSNVQLIIEVKKGTAAGRNAGVKASRYDYVAFIDADCEAPQDWLSILVKYHQKAKQKNSKIIAVGGANIPPDNADEFVKAIGIALDSYVGSFTSNAVAGIQIYTLLAVLGVVVTAGYILWMLQQAFYGPVKEEYNGVKDEDTLEKIYSFVLIAVIMLVGIYPAILTDVIKLGIAPITGLLGG